MSCTYYLRDKKITNETINKLKLLEKEFNSKLDALYNELNDKITNILPINNEDVMEECRQYEPKYINETKLYIDPINKYVIGVQIDKDFIFRNFDDLSHFLSFYKENESKYIIVDEYNNVFTLESFLKEVNLMKYNINVPLFDKCTKMLIDIIDSYITNVKEKEYRKEKLLKTYNKMMELDYIDTKYYDLAHEIKSLEFLSKYPNLKISNDHKSKSGCDFKIYNNYNIECVSSSSGNERKNGLYKFHGSGIFDYNKKENIILTRLTSSIDEKTDFYYKHIKNKSIDTKEPYIIFLSLGNLSYGALSGEFGFIMNKVLFGVGHTVLYYDKKNNNFFKSEYEYKKEIFNHNNSPINCNYFSKKEASCISGILFTDALLEEHYTKENTFLFINPFSINKIKAKDFKNIVYWKQFKSDNKYYYVPRFNGKNLNDKLRQHYF